MLILVFMSLAFFWHVSFLSPFHLNKFHCEIWRSSIFLLSLGLSVVFSLLEWEYVLLGMHNMELKYPFLHVYQGMYHVTWCIIGETNLDCLVSIPFSTQTNLPLFVYCVHYKWVSKNSLHWKEELSCVPWYSPCLITHLLELHLFLTSKLLPFVWLGYTYLHGKHSLAF